MDISSHHHLWIKICRRLLSLFIKSLLLHVPTRKMPNLLDTYNTYMEYIEEASFLWTYNAKERIREISNILRLKKIIEIREYDDKDAVTHQKVAILA
jgi:hypothetical protein